MGQKTLKPADPVRSQYTIEPGLLKMRAVDLPGMTSISFRDLLPSIPDPIFPSEQGIEAIRQSDPGIAVRGRHDEDQEGRFRQHPCLPPWLHPLGGAPYAEMLKVTRDVIEERTGTEDIRLRAGVGLRFRETEEYIKRFSLDRVFQREGQGHGAHR